MVYLALKGIEVDRGVIAQPGTTGSQSVSSLSFRPSVVLFDGGDKANVEPNFVPNAEMVFGVATSSTERAAMWIGSDSNNPPYPSDTDLSTSAVIRSLTPGSPSVDAVADFVSMDSNGFTINWSSADATARRVGWIALGGAAALYRSVGTTATNLTAGSPTLEITGTTATFSGPLPDNVGVGDVLTYNTGADQLAFIHGRTSSTVFTVKDKDGGTPTAAGGRNGGGCVSCLHIAEQLGNSNSKPAHHRAQPG